jgi:hypothetical protein
MAFAYQESFSGVLTGPLELNVSRRGFADVPAAGALTSGRAGDRKSAILRKLEAQILSRPHRAFAAPGIIDPRLLGSHEIGRF